MKISFNKAEETGSVNVNYVMLGGEIDLSLFLDTSVKGVTSQLTKVFGNFSVRTQFNKNNNSF